MKAIREISSSKIVYIFDENKKVRITDSGLISPIKAIDIKSATHEVIEVPSPQVEFIPNKLTYTKEGWGFVDKDEYLLNKKNISRDNAKLSRADFKLALLERGELDNLKAAMSDPSADPRAVILWEDALEFRRTNKDLLSLASELGYTEEQLDDIFGINS